jgi:peptidoglycan/xylan/chitin deacetylase (PgdA/CDA1 family)
LKRQRDQIVRFVPMRLMRTILPGRVFIVCYHAVSARPLPHITNLYDIKSPQQFEQDLLFFKQHCVVAGHDELVAHQQGRHRLPAGSVCITFDDGFSQCHDTVRPLLLKHGMPCTFFVCTSMIDNRTMMYRNAISLCLDRLRTMNDAELGAVAARLGSRYRALLDTREQLGKWMLNLTYPERDKLQTLCELLALDIDEFLRRHKPYMTREQIVDLSRDGFTIGAHSCNHPELWLLNWADATREIVESCDVVRQLTLQPSVPFAFPFNGARLSRDKLAQLRREHPFVGLFYDTNDLRLERDFVVNRIGGDTPAGCEAGQSNFPLLMREAYALEPLRHIKRLVQGLPSGLRQIANPIRAAHAAR